MTAELARAPGPEGASRTRAGVGDGSETTPKARFAAWAAITVAAFVLFGDHVPFINEYVYVVRLHAVAHPGYIPSDWSLSGSFGENLVFNTLLWPVARLLPIVAIAWIGRVVCWAALAALLVALMRRTGIGLLAGTLAVLAWMPWELRIVGGDWMFGTFEAKPLAYIAMLGAIVAALDRRVALAMLLGGAAVSLHPGVGVSVAPALAIALLVDATTRRAALRTLPLAALAAVPGVVGVVHDMHGSSADRDVYRFIAQDIYPFHMDPWYFGKLTFAALVAMALVNTWYAYSDRGTRGLRLLAHFELVCALPTVLGVVAWETGRYEYLRFFPFRVFPVVVSLGVAFTAAHALPRWWHARRAASGPRLDTATAIAAAVVLTVLVAAVAQNPVREAGFLARRTLRDWTGHTDEQTELAGAYHWVRDHTPAGSVVIAPPEMDPHYDTERPQIATFGVPRWDAVAEWKRRILAQLGPSDTAARRALDHGTSIGDEYRALSPSRVQDLVRRYGARYLVTDRSYPFTLVDRNGKWRVYRLTQPA